MTIYRITLENEEARAGRMAGSNLIEGLTFTVKVEASSEEKAIKKALTKYRGFSVYFVQTQEAFDKEEEEEKRWRVKTIAAIKALEEEKKATGMTEEEYRRRLEELRGY